LEFSTNGYGDHFLQDSFAAGHLIYKILVMQWFAQYVSENMGLVGTAGLPDQSVLTRMDEPKAAGHGQGGIAGRSLYAGPDLSRQDNNDRETGTSPADTQSAHERIAHAERVAGSGVAAEGGRTQEQNYSDYGQFLNSSYLQKASGAVHDWFNSKGLYVANKHDKYHVGGDDSLLTKSDSKGVELAGQAAQMSQECISELLERGHTSITPESIFDLVPREVLSDGGSGKGIPLESWNDGVVRDLCRTKIFPEVIDSLSSLGIRILSPEMVSGGVSH
jgi:hypothetical protein